MSTSRREVILVTVDDLVREFLYDGRKEDEVLPRGAIEEALEAGEVSKDEIVARFKCMLEEML